MKQELPPGRAALFERLIDLLLGAWEEERQKDTIGGAAAENPEPTFRELLAEPGHHHNGVRVDRGELMRDLGHLVFQLTSEFAGDAGARGRRTNGGRAGVDDSPAIDIPGARLHRLLGGMYEGRTLVEPPPPDDPEPLSGEADGWAHRVVAFIREKGGLLDPAAGSGDLTEFSFPHRQYGEFLAGWWLVQHARYEHGGSDLVARLSAPAGDPLCLCPTLAEWDEVWREPVFFSVSQLLCANQEAGIEQLVRALAPEPEGAEPDRLIIAAEILVAHGDEAAYQRTGDFWGKVRSALCTRLVDPALAPALRDRLGSALALLGDTRPGVGGVLFGEGEKALEIPDILWLPVEPPPGGRFTMGSGDEDRKADDDEKPPFECPFIKEPFAISAYPVTVAQFGAFVKAGGYADKGRAWWTDDGLAWKDAEKAHEPGYLNCGADWGRMNVPVTGVSFHEAVAFCRWLRHLGDRFPELPEAERLRHARLPAEWEWEFCARGPDTREEGRGYPWGDADHDIERRCNIGASEIGHPSSVGLFGEGGRSWCGAEDLSGNVWEWTGTPWIDYSKGYEMNYAEEDIALPALRGGAFCNYSWNARASFRLGLNSQGRNDDFGFRVLSSPFFPRAGA